MKRSKFAELVLVLVLAFLYLPIVVLVANSFNASRFGGEWAGFTFKWYSALFASNQREYDARELRVLHAAPPESLRAVASARRLASRASCRLNHHATHASGTSTEKPITAASAEACGRLRSGNVRW